MSINRNTIERITLALLSSPTPENSQPWRFKFYPDNLEIFHESDRAKLATFPDNLSVLGMGMLTEILEIVCNEEGLKPQITYHLEDRSDDRPWMSVKFIECKSSFNPLAKGIQQRHTDRRRYAGGSLNDLVFTQLKQEGDKALGANLYFTNYYPSKYLKLLRDADQSVMDWEEMRQDMARWVRFTDRKAESTRDGMPWRSLLRANETKKHYLQSRIWWLFASIDWCPKWAFKLQRLVFDDSGDLTPSYFDDGAGLGCVTVDSGSEIDLISAGRLVIRTWIMLNLSGYAFQPLTNLASITYPKYLKQFKLPSSLRHLVQDDLGILREVYKFGAQELPIFCFRTGLPLSPHPDAAKTLRRQDRIILD